jgi:hypothetical protein
MELAQAKIPYLPPEWTVAHSVKYAAKLAVFILVPGLHQIACKRRILGGLIFILYVGTEFILSNKPVEVAYDYFLPRSFYHALSDVAQYAAWALLAIDLKRVDSRNFRLGYLLGLVCVFCPQFLPFHHQGLQFIFVEQSNQACPAFCKYDVIEYEYFLRQKHITKVGDYVVVTTYRAPTFVTKVLAEQKECTPDGRVPPYLMRGNAWFCRKSPWGDILYQYLIVSGPVPLYQIDENKSLSRISDLVGNGIKPRKIGNTHEYFLFTDGITDAVGNALLVLYKWTGINLFGLSK